MRIILQEHVLKKNHKILLDGNDTGRFLLDLCHYSQHVQPQFWLVAEFASNFVIMADDFDLLEEIRDAVILARADELVLLKGEFWEVCHPYFCGDYAALLSITDPPPLAPDELCKMFYEIVHEDPDDEKGLARLVGAMGPNDIYINCYEWEFLTCFASPEVLARAKAFTLSHNLPIQEGFTFENRWWTLEGLARRAQVKGSKL